MNMLRRFNAWQADFFFGLDSLDELAPSDKVIYFGFQAVAAFGIIFPIVL